MTKMQIEVWSIEDVLQSQLQWGHCSWQSVGSLRAEVCPTRLLMCQAQNWFRFGKHMQDPKPLFGIGFATTWDGFIYDFYTVHVQFEATLQESIHWIWIQFDSSFSVSVPCPSFSYFCVFFSGRCHAPVLLQRISPADHWNRGPKDLLSSGPEIPGESAGSWW